MGAPLKKWAATICAAWNKTAAQFIEVGRQLLAAEAELSRDDFATLIGRPHQQGQLPFSYSVARKLMSIGSDERLAEFLAHGPNSLPPCWRTLYDLSLLTNEQFAAARKRGLIKPDMERSTVQHVRESWYQKPPTSSRIRYRVTHHVREVRAVGYRSPQERAPGESRRDNTLRPDTSTPGAEVPSALQSMSDDARRILRDAEQLDRLALLVAAWEAAEQADRDRFLNHIGARLIEPPCKEAA
jgi:hypothetical protein